MTFKKIWILTPFDKFYNAPCEYTKWSTIAGRDVYILSNVLVALAKYTAPTKKISGQQTPFINYCLVTCYCPVYAWNICRWALSNNKSINFRMNSIFFSCIRILLPVCNWRYYGIYFFVTNFVYWLRQRVASKIIL